MSSDVILRAPVLGVAVQYSVEVLLTERKATTVPRTLRPDVIVHSAQLRGKYEWWLECWVGERQWRRQYGRSEIIGLSTEEQNKGQTQQLC